MCAECGYVTKWKHYLNVHMRKHAGDLRYKCLSFFTQSLVIYFSWYCLTFSMLYFCFPAVTVFFFIYFLT